MTVGGSTTYYFFDAAKRWRTVHAPTNSQSDPNRVAFAYTGHRKAADLHQVREWDGQLDGDLYL